MVFMALEITFIRAFEVIIVRGVVHKILRVL